MIGSKLGQDGLHAQDFGRLVGDMRQGWAVLGAMTLGWNTVQFDVTNPADSYQRALKLLGL